MDFTEYIQSWAKGDALQGKIMITLGFLTLLCIIFIFKSDNTLLKGMIIPLSLLTLISLSYGIFLASSRISHSTIVVEQYQETPKIVIQKELIKAKADFKNYTMIKPFWAVLLIVSVLLFFIFTKDYYKGISLGLLVFATSALIIDTLLHHRLKPYLTMLNELT